MQFSKLYFFVFLLVCCVACEGRNSDNVIENPQTSIPPSPVLEQPKVPSERDLNSHPLPVQILEGGLLRCTNDSISLMLCEVVPEKKELVPQQDQISKFEISYVFSCSGHRLGFAFNSDQQAIPIEKTGAEGGQVTVFGVGPVVLEDIEPSQTVKAKVSPDCGLSIRRVIVTPL